MKVLGLAVTLALLAGCSASTLRCGSDGESSFVDLVNVPKDVASQSRYYAELCAFAFQEEE